MRVRKIAKENLGEIGSAEWVDRSRSPYIEGGVAWVPVRPDAPCDAEIPERSLYRGRGFYMVGDVAVIHGDKPSPAEIDEILRFRHPRGIVWIEALLDLTRTPRTELLHGTAGEVRHRESGYTYILDPQKVMFSMGNRNEKTRIAGLIRAGSGHERVADMFAGIGYFTIPMAGAGARVHAMEINPVAFGYLERNIRENRLLRPGYGNTGGLPHCADRYVRSDRDGAFRCGHDALRGPRPCKTRHVSSTSTVSARLKSRSGDALKAQVFLLPSRYIK